MEKNMKFLRLVFAVLVAVGLLAITTAHLRVLGFVFANPNSPPVAVDDNYTVHGNLFVPGNSVLTNDFDPDGDSIHLQSCGQTSHGTVSCDLQYQAFTYQPNNPYVGSDSFTYEVCDSTGACDTGTVNLNVINNPPVAVDDSYTLHGSLSISGPNPLLLNDYDPDNDSIHLASYTQASHGTFVYSFLYGSISYTPTFGYVGADSINYELCDSLGLCTNATVSFNIVNRPPMPVDDVYVVRGGSLNISGPNALRENDSDPDGNSFNIASYTQTSHGTVSYSQTYGSLN